MASTPPFLHSTFCLLPSPLRPFPARQPQASGLKSSAPDSNQPTHNNPMIIWSGFGFLPIVFVVVFMLAFGADQQNAPGHDRNLAYALLLTGIVSGALGWW